MLIHCGTQIINSERLVLRPFHYTDDNDMLTYWISDPKIQSMYSEPIYTTKEEVKELLDKYISSYEKLNYYRWAIMTLELYFKQKLQESFEFRAIGSWWEPKGAQNEIDIVAVYLDNKRALVVEVKRQKKNFKPQAFEEKVKLLRSKEMHKYDIETACWDMDDM